MEKTNALRILDSAGIKYVVREYSPDITDGEEVAAATGTDKERTFKTLVTEGNDLKHYVFVIPVDSVLDLKKAAKAANVKRVEMIKQKELFPLTGYVHGGCSPIGMKKKFFTVIDDTATLFDTIMLSGGRKGLQIELATGDLIAVTESRFAEIASLKPKSVF